MSESHTVTQSKASPTDPRFDLERPRARKLKKAPIIALVGAVGCLLLVTLYIALQPKANHNAQAQHIHIDPDAVKRAMPDALRLSATDYAQAEPPPEIPQLGPPLQGDLGGFQINQPAPALPSPSYQPPPPPQQPSAAELERLRQAQLAREAREKAQRSQIFFTDTGQGTKPAIQNHTANSPSPVLPQAPSPQHDQAWLTASLQVPRSPYEIKAGAIIPAVLMTGINSDLPGQIMAQVREQVYDTVSGRYLLIPQGSRVLGRYDSRIQYGQERALVIWTRLIFPDGASIQLGEMPGVDLAGQAGYHDQVNHHWSKLAGGVVLSSLLAGSAGYESDRQGFQGQVYANIGQEINRTGQRITHKHLNIQPTIEIRPGQAINILVNRDMVLKPIPLNPPDPLDAFFLPSSTNQGEY